MAASYIQLTWLSVIVTTSLLTHFKSICQFGIVKIIIDLDKYLLD